VRLLLERFEAGGAAAFGVLEVLGVERLDVRDNVKMLRMGKHGAKKDLKLVCQVPTEGGSGRKRLISLGELAAAA
jgi:hypothetical protein